jgi:hypothetical protein
VNDEDDRIVDALVRKATDDKRTRPLRRLIGYRVVRTVVRDGVEVREWFSRGGTWTAEPRFALTSRVDQMDQWEDERAGIVGARIVPVYLTVRRRRK